MNRSAGARVGGRRVSPGFRGPHLVVALLLTASLCGCPVVTTLAAGESVVLGGSPSDWLVVLYMCADNELEAQAIEDLNELEAVDLSGSGISILALVDRIDGYDTSNGDWTGTRLYEIVHDGNGYDGEINSLPVASPGLGIEPGAADTEMDLSDPGTLDALLDFAVARYDPTNVALVIWGHGSGYRAPSSRPPQGTDGFKATSFDDTSGGESLLTAELAHAISGHPVDVVAFDTCFGASVEVAYELRQSAQFMIGSQDQIPADGWEYDDLLSRFLASDQSPLDFCTAAVDSFRQSYPSLASATISVIDLGLVNPAMQALNNLSDGIFDLVPDNAARNRMRERLFYDVEDFYATPGDLSIDLRHMAQIVSEDHPSAGDLAAALDRAVDSAVVQEWHNRSGNPDAGGLSIHYIPLDSDGSASPSHDSSYLRGSDVEWPLEFVANSTWVPAAPDGPGLLHRLFYEVLE